MTIFTRAPLAKTSKEQEKGQKEGDSEKKVNFDVKNCELKVFIEEITMNSLSQTSDGRRISAFPPPPPPPPPLPPLPPPPKLPNPGRSGNDVTTSLDALMTECRRPLVPFPAAPRLAGTMRPARLVVPAAEAAAAASAADDS